MFYKVEPEVLRFKLVKMAPYFGSVVYRFRPVVQKGLGTFACDAKGNWYYDTEVPLTPDEQVSALYHEVNHWLRNHFARKHDREPRRWNLATDAEINDWWPVGMTVPEACVTPQAFGLPKEELAEWYYDRIYQYDAHVRKDATALSPGTGPCVSHPGCDNQDKPADIDPKTFDVKQRGVIHMPACGSAAGNPSGSEGELEEGGISQVEGEAIRRDVAEKVQAQAKLRGNLPGSLVKWADELLNPVVPWTKLLRMHARRAAVIIQGHTHQTYQRPARRSAKPLILPKHIAKKVVAAFYVDTSGSVSNEELAQAFTEVRAALRTNMAEMTVTLVDAAIYSTTKLKDAKNFKPEKVQRGGTDMTLCFPHAAKLNPKPNLVVVITDGETPWPKEEPPFHTIVVLTQDKPAYSKPPEWAKVVVMK